MKLDRNTVLICIVCLWLGSWSSSSSAPDARPKPLDDRPVLRWIARAARTLLWVSLVAEEPPKPQPEPQHVAGRGDDHLDFGRGW